MPEVPPLAMTPAMFVKPVPLSVSVRLVVSAAARETPLLTTSVAAPVGLTELLVHVWSAPRTTATFWLVVAEPIVTTPAPLATVIPPVPSVSVRLVPPPWSVVVPPEVNEIENAAWSALRFATWLSQ